MIPSCRSAGLDGPGVPAPLNAVVARGDAAAMAAAVEVTETTARADGCGRPLAGVPLTVKDWIDVVG